MMMARSEGSQFIAIQHNATHSDPQTAVCGVSRALSQIKRQGCVWQPTVTNPAGRLTLQSHCG
jgi:hypothetical protein